MVGYQGESARPVSQRHSASLFSATQTGAARAPARWAIEVSQVTTRSRQVIAAAVSTNASGPASKSAPERLDPHRRRQKRKLLFADALLQGNEPDARDLGERRQGRSGIDRARSASGSGLPCQTTPILKPAEPMRRAHISRKTRLGREIGNRGRNRVEPRAECMRQAADRDLGVEFDLRPAANRRIRTLAFEDRSRRSLGGQTKVASTPAAVISGK